MTTNTKNSGHFRLNFTDEIISWAMLALALASVEGAVVGVLVKNAYAGLVSAGTLDQLVALVTGAPAFSNLLSFVWAGISQGRSKVAFIVTMGMVCSISVLLVALAPVTELGAWLVTLGAILARVGWSAILTVRSVIWRANYPRYVRAKITGKVATLSSILMAVTGVLIGYFLDAADQNFRTIYFVVAACGVFGALYFSKQKVRRHGLLLKREREERLLAGRSGLKMFRILKTDIAFRHYMRTMFVLGSGNLMFMAPLIIILKEDFALSQLQQVLITSSLPLIMIPFFVPRWAKMLSRKHVVEFRAIHSWIFVASIGCFFVAAISGWVAFLWAGSVLFGIAIAGAVLGWNLGHNDFSQAHNSGQYMGVHVTLTGIRGLIAPLIGVNLYHLLKGWTPEYANWVLLFPLILTTAGALMFVRLAAQRKHSST